jgi:Domain of unknown function (DUF4331)
MLKEHIHMTWKTDVRALVAALALGVSIVGCGDTTSPRSPMRSASASLDKGGNNQADQDDDQDDEDTIYDQTDFLGNPLVSEVTIQKANHALYNKTQPYNTATFLPQTAAFVTGVAGRPASLAATLGSVLYPDMLVVDPSKNPNTAGWLSWALANGWGGRKLTDDVVDTGLIAIFSSLLSPVGASCAPGQLPLCTDNVGANDVAFSSTFPYLAGPH